jgi:hypothetical protein
MYGDDNDDKWEVQGVDRSKFRVGQNNAQTAN